MSFSAFLLVLGAVFCHATWNLFVKGSSDRLAALALVMAVTGLVGLALIAFAPLPQSREVWLLLVLSGLLHLGYNISLLLAYRFADLSLAYPLARGAVPLLVLALSFMVDRQWPGERGLLGLILVAGGIMWLGLGARGQADGRGVALAFLTSLWIAGYTVIDGLGMRAALNPLTFLGWTFALNLGLPLITWVFIWRGRVPQGLLRKAPYGLLSPLAYAFVLWAQLTTDFAAVSALRESSVIVAALFGVYFLGEGQARLRLSAASLVALGAALVVMA